MEIKKGLLMVILVDMTYPMEFHVGTRKDQK